MGDRHLSSMLAKRRRKPAFLKVTRAPEKHAGSKLADRLVFASIFALRPATLGVSAGRGATLGALVAFSRLS
jgi:hypothetical protein